MTVALSRRAALGALAVAASAPAAAAVQPDPIFPAIDTARAAEAALTGAMAGEGPEQLRIADEAGERADDARNALSDTLPTTPAGFRALVQFHAADVLNFEPDTYGALALRDIAAAMEALLQARARASP